MTALVLAMVAGYGVHLVFSGAVLGWHGLGPGPASTRAAGGNPLALWRWASAAAPTPELVAALVVVGVSAAAGTFAVFGGLVAPVVAATLAMTAPVAASRAAHERQRLAARGAWPRMIEEVRLGATALGLSIPAALFEAGSRAPTVMQGAFVAAQREWLLSTDFERSLDVLTTELDDATADAVAETLLVAHQIGGTEIDRTLASLAEDRILDLEGRRDAEARQAGARFARWFVLVVPAGMALVGLGVGTGRAAYGEAGAQLVVAAALASIAGCWLWASTIMRLPRETRVFAGRRPLGEPR